ncbi:MAG: hypothetical protein IT495_15475 [Gammaproteobacteria bacterium]|nr:hypothetical protein [Gammaproteobacteria bacterium]
MTSALGRVLGGQRLMACASVHPCVIDGHRTLVYHRGLPTRDPGAFRALRSYASANGFELREDRRRVTLGVVCERRARAMPLLALAGAVLANSAGAGEFSPGASAPLEEIEVIAVPQRQAADRDYLVEAGKRFVGGPYGEVESILAVAAEVRRFGERRRVRSRGMTVPDPAVNVFVDRYDYRFPASCGGGSYSYYEGDGFAALGYQAEDRVILDVLVGGGPFTAPRLWGPYDQVLGANVKMELMFGNGEQDGMGLLKASYSIGMVAAMSDELSRRLGAGYAQHVAAAADCTGAPEARLAARDDRDLTGKLN